MGYFVPEIVYAMGAQVAWLLVLYVLGKKNSAKTSKLMKTSTPAIQRSFVFMSATLPVSLNNMRFDYIRQATSFIRLDNLPWIMLV